MRRHHSEAMNKASNLIVGATLCIAVGVIVYALVYRPHQKDVLRWQQVKAAALERKARGSYVEREQELAPGQKIRLVVIPHSSGIDLLDTKCLVYTNTEFRQANMVCPDAKQTDIEVDDTR